MDEDTKMDELGTQGRRIVLGLHLETESVLHLEGLGRLRREKA